MANIFMMNEEIARGMVCFFHQKKHSYLIFFWNFYFCWNIFFIIVRISTLVRKQKILGKLIRERVQFSAKKWRFSQKTMM
jgi:hypothetical protein